MSCLRPNVQLIGLSPGNFGDAYSYHRLQPWVTTLQHVWLAPRTRGADGAWSVILFCHNDADSYASDVAIDHVLWTATGSNPGDQSPTPALVPLHIHVPQHLRLVQARVEQTGFGANYIGLTARFTD